MPINKNNYCCLEMIDWIFGPDSPPMRPSESGGNKSPKLLIQESLKGPEKDDEPYKIDRMRPSCLAVMSLFLLFEQKFGLEINEVDMITLYETGNVRDLITFLKTASEKRSFF